MDQNFGSSYSDYSDYKYFTSVLVKKRKEKEKLKIKIENIKLNTLSTDFVKLKELISLVLESSGTSMTS